MLTEACDNIFLDVKIKPGKAEGRHACNYLHGFHVFQRVNAFSTNHEIRVVSRFGNDG
jgi:hypothetical protein